MATNKDPKRLELVRLYQQAHEELHQIESVIFKPADDPSRDAALRQLLEGRRRAIREIQDTLRHECRAR